jgi:Skp family chaperone for outer membrane proteins
MNKKSGLTKTVLGIAFLIAFTLMQASAANAFRRFKVPDPEQVISDLTKELGLSDMQVEQIRPVIQNHAEKRNEIFDQYRSEGRSGRQEMRSQMEALREETESELASVLTEEQMEKYRAYQEEKRQKRHNNKGKAMRGGGGPVF